MTPEDGRLRPLCRHLLLVDVQQREALPFCRVKATSDRLCPWYPRGGYAECGSFEAGDPLRHVIALDSPEAGAFTASFVASHPAFAEIVVDFMAPEWQREQQRGRPRSGFKQTPPVSLLRQPLRFFSWSHRNEPSPAPARSSADELPPGVDSVLELGDPSEPTAVDEPPAGKTGGPQAILPVRMEHAADYLGDLRLVDRRGSLRVEWSSPGSRAHRPPLDLRWRGTYGSGQLLLDARSGGPGCLVYGTRLRRVSDPDAPFAHEELVCAVHPTEGRTLWRWRRVPLVAPPQVVEDAVLLRRREALWALDAHTGRIRWTMEARAEHAEEAGIIPGAAVIHVPGSFRAVDLKGRGIIWEVPASRFAPRPLVQDGCVVLCGDHHVRGVQADSGREMWRVAGPGPDVRRPALAGFHAVFWTYDGVLQAVDVRSGRRAWAYRTASGGPGDDPVVDGRVVYFRAGTLGDPVLVALDAERGRLLWRAPLGENLTSGLAAHDGVVYVLNTHHDVLALQAVSGRLLWRLICPASGLTGQGASMITWADGLIYCFDVS